MKAKDLAYEIGITRQELRHELKERNFGVDPSSKEFPEGVAMGIIRVLGPKYKKRKEELMKKEAAKIKAAAAEAGMTEEEYLISIGKGEKPEETKEEREDDEEIDEDSEEKTVDLKTPVRFATSKKVEEQKAVFEEEKKAQEERRKKEREAQKELEEMNTSKKKVFSGRKKGLNITRKIEFDDTEKEKIQKHKTDQHIHKAHKRMKMEVLGEEDLSPEERIALLAEEEMQRKLEDEAFKASQAKRTAKMNVRKKLDEKMQKKEGVIEIPEVISVKEFSEKVGIGVAQLTMTLVKNGIMATINTEVDFETWLLLADDLGIKIEKADTEHSVEDILEGDISKLMEDDPDKLKERPPVIVVMGHVDHGKTSILDFYRNTAVVDKEAGGITQHIGAYQVEKKGKKITFLDTPGHEAFTSMRARGAKITDIAILVVAADEGIKAQTEEAINHAKEAGVPIIVAMNKMDKEGANPEKLKGDLMNYDLVAEDYGGDVMMVPVSAKEGTGMDALLDSILLQAEVIEPKANPDRAAIATVVESHLDKAMGAVATVVVNTGTMKMKDSFIAGAIVGRIRTMMDSSGKRTDAVGPSGTVQISGFEEVPAAGDIIQVMKNEKAARDRAEHVKELQRKEGTAMGMSEILSRIQTGKMDLLKVVLKADTQGSIEAIRQMFDKIENTEVGVKVIHAATGGVSESDVMMAAASGGMVIGFHVGMTPQVRTLAEKEGVEVQKYDIIYKLMEDIEAILTGMLKPEEVIIETGKAEVKAIFYTAKKRQIVGAKVENGSIVNGGDILVIRDGEEVHKSVISNLKSFEKNVDEVQAVNECGIEFADKFDYKEGDILVCSKTEQKMKTL